MEQSVDVGGALLQRRPSQQRSECSRRCSLGQERSSARRLPVYKERGVRKHFAQCRFVTLSDTCGVGGVETAAERRALERS
jgi:hypothetical protein